MNNTNYDELSDWLGNARRDLDRKRDRLAEEAEMVGYYQKALEATDELLSENESLRKENESLEKESESLEKENDKLRTELDGIRSQLQEKEVQLSEQRKLTTGMARKSSGDELMKAIRVFLNISKRKSLDKRVHVKMMIMELVAAANIALPDDLRETLACLDDEQPEPKIIIESAADVIAAGGVKNVKNMQGDD